MHLGTNNVSRRNKIRRLGKKSGPTKFREYVEQIIPNEGTKMKNTWSKKSRNKILWS
jgi:hypothetical protein